MPHARDSAGASEGHDQDLVSREASTRSVLGRVQPGDAAGRREAPGCEIVAPVSGKVSQMRTVAIACQGGGSHTAFTGGVLQRLLVDGNHRVVALSGTSGGAVCA